MADHGLALTQIVLDSSAIPKLLVLTHPSFASEAWRWRPAHTSRSAAHVVDWAEEQAVILPWTTVRGGGDLAAVARRLRKADRAGVHTQTDPAGGIARAAALFDGAPLVSGRKVIDVSRDGGQNAGEVPASVVRDSAIAQDVTSNGLPATSSEDPHVGDWYRANVVGGVGSFVVIADGFDALAEAFQRKLLRQVAGPRPTPALAYFSALAAIRTTFPDTVERGWR